MLWYLVFTVVTLNGSAPRTFTDYRAFRTQEECVAVRDRLNNNPDNATFAECFYDKLRAHQF